MWSVLNTLSERQKVNKTKTNSVMLCHHDKSNQLIVTSFPNCDSRILNLAIFVHSMMEIIDEVCENYQPETKPR